MTFLQPDPIRRKFDVWYLSDHKCALDICKNINIRTVKHKKLLLLNVCGYMKITFFKLKRININK